MYIYNDIGVGFVISVTHQNAGCKIQFEGL